MIVVEDRPDVLVAIGSVLKITPEHIARLRERSLHNERRRARLCAHLTLTDPIHEMVISLARGTYIRPHRHVGKTESFHMIEGELEVILFDDNGVVREVIRMGPYRSGKTFFYRLTEPCFHTVMVSSTVAILHETTNGPFNPAETEYPAWGPVEGDPSVSSYLDQLSARITR
jgi:cupin fold WbuC family metalloprotein